ncbi:MAG: phosphoglucosamine mutase [Pseudomonadota bacterium]|jgi:phosphoglucosamine mutase
MNVRFGTDGVRGRVGGEVHAELALALGNALAVELGARGVEGPVAVAMDTRPSGPMLEAAVVAGICAAGARAVRCGVIPTAGLSHVVAAHGWGAGVMITASHNPAHDNGLKVVDARGRKADPALREALERRMAVARVHDDVPGDVVVWDEAGDEWVDAVRRRVPRGAWLSGTRIVLDAANGAARGHAARLLGHLGAEVIAIGEGSGAAINDACGAVHPGALAAEVRRTGADAGIALDGDADRVVLCDSQGAILDGDAILWLLAGGGTVVGTVMSNDGLARGLAARGVSLVRSAVGDSHVAAAMEAHGAALGAEPSGHVLFADGLPTGCGMLAALRALAPDARGLRSRLEGYRPTRQVHATVPRGGVAGGQAPPPQAEDPRLREAMGALEARGCRIVVRPSGTEPVTRIMVEHEDEGVARAGLDTLRAILGGTR